jgi:hypothetical protein
MIDAIRGCDLDRRNRVLHGRLTRKETKMRKFVIALAMSSALTTQAPAGVAERMPGSECSRVHNSGRSL